MIRLSAEVESGFIEIEGLTPAQVRKMHDTGFSECHIWPDSTGIQLTRSAAAMRAAMKILAGQTYEISDMLFDCFKPDMVTPKSALLPVTLRTKTQPWDYQIPAVTFALDRLGTLWAAGCGTGKSKMLIDLCQTTNARRVLIFAQKAVVLNWPNEIAAHALPDFAKYCAVDVGISITGRAHQIMAYMGPSGKGNEGFIIVDIASAWREAVARLLMCYEWDVIAVDEAQCIRNPENQLSQLVYELAERNPRAKRLALTATPLGNVKLSIYGIGRFIAPEIVGYDKWAFDRKYGVFETKNVPLGKPKPGQPQVRKDVQVFKRLKDEDEFSAMIGKFTFHIAKADALPNLPPQIHQKRYAVLTPAARAAYKKLQKELEAEFMGHNFSASSPSVLAMRLQQFTGLYKGEAFAEVLENNGDDPLVVYARFTDDLSIIREVCKKAKISYLEQSGTHTEWLEFQRGAGVVLGVQIQSGGAGINLTRSAHVVYYSHGRSNIDYEQSQSRAHRPGQNNTVVYTHLCVDGTVDDTIVDALIAGVDLSQAILKKINTKKSGEMQHAA